MRDRLKQLTAGVVIYGAGDAAIQAVNFLLLPLYVRYLTPTDYGALLMLTSVETFLKLMNRWGLDGAFMRYYLDRDEGHARARFTSTIVIFIAVLDGALLAAALLGSPWIAGWLFTIGFLKLSLWKAVLALVAWAYFLGVALRRV